MKLILRIIVATLSVLAASYVVPGIHIADIQTAVIFAIVIGALNMFIKPIISILAFPITILTLGLFSLVINALIIILGANLVPGVAVGGFLAALLFSIVMGIVNAFLGLLAK